MANPIETSAKPSPFLELPFGIVHYIQFTYFWSLTYPADIRVLIYKLALYLPSNQDFSHGNNLGRSVQLLRMNK